MPTFLFDTFDGSRAAPSGTEADLTDLAAARLHALDLLKERVRYELPDGDHRTFAVTVKDAAGRNVLTASLALMVTYPVANN